MLPFSLFPFASNLFTDQPTCFRQGTSEESGKKSSHANVATVRPTERQWQEQAARYGNGPTKRPTPTPPLRESTSASKVSVKETVRSLERAALQQDSPEVVELSYVKADSSRGRCVPLADYICYHINKYAEFGSVVRRISGTILVPIQWQCVNRISARI